MTDIEIGIMVKNMAREMVGEMRASAKNAERMYHLYINKYDPRTGKEKIPKQPVRLTATPVPHEKAMIIKSKQSDPARCYVKEV
ncbi:MAG TPA: hypothetical protein PKL77_10815 [Candidatus Omnitrophota bacterium]|nr:hypothetical protein [Candidatus Omnitrophota bacterium]